MSTDINADIAATQAFLATLAATIEDKTDEEILALDEARNRRVDDLRKAVAANYGALTVAELEFLAGQRTLRFRRGGKKEPLVRLLAGVVTEEAVAGDHLEAIKEAAGRVHDDRRARASAIELLNKWAQEILPYHASHADPTMRGHYNAALVQYGKWFQEFLVDRDEDAALRGILAAAMQRVLAHDNEISSVYQVRVGDLGQHLAERAAHQYVVRCVAAGALGTRLTRRLGINREYGLI